MNKKMIIDAYCHIRTIDQSIPDEVLDFMKDAAIEKLDKIGNQGRKYDRKLDREWDQDIYTVDNWNVAVEEGFICNDDGSGYWVKDGLRSGDEVFSTHQLDATHVV